MVVHIGTSGWSYDHWENVLYESGTPPRERLDVYARRFSTVELNASFYRWPADRTFTGWRQRLPDGFLLSVKAPRGLTHAKRLYAPEAWIDRMAHCWHELGRRRGVLLVQLPPQFARDDARLSYFLGRLPPWLRVSVEFRNSSWHTDEVFDLLARHNAAYCVMSGSELPWVLRATAPWVYVRMHGPDPHHLYAAATATRNCAGGPTGSVSGTATARKCSSTSTTTVMGTQSATPRPCAAYRGDDPPGRGTAPATSDRTGPGLLASGARAVPGHRSALPGATGTNVSPVALEMEHLTGPRPTKQPYGPESTVRGQPRTACGSGCWLCGEP